jgi:hypothetical protein
MLFGVLPPEFNKATSLLIATRREGWNDDNRQIKKDPTVIN